jgi:hypothetical protein
LRPSEDLEQSFDQLVLLSIDKGLSIYGESSKQVIYWNFTRITGLKSVEIPSHIEEFCATLHEIFGASAVSIEGTIVSEIKREFSLESIGTRSLVSILKIVRNLYVKKELIQN